jgi:hypothetical protein
MLVDVFYDRTIFHVSASSGWLVVAKYLFFRDHLPHKISGPYIKLLKPEVHVTVFSNSVRTSQKTHRLSLTKINLLIREILAVYCENRTKFITALS